MKKLDIAVHILVALYGISLVFLFWKFACWSDGSVYESDLPAHISMMQEGWFYSLTAGVYYVLYLFPLPIARILVALFLAVCAVGSIWGCAYLFSICKKKYFGGKSPKENPFSGGNMLCAFILNLVMPIYIKGMSDGRYIGMQSGSIWHNSTYIVMKFLGILCLIVFFELAEKYKKPALALVEEGMTLPARYGISVKQWCLFAGLLLLTTATKPSFLIVFAPVMALMLLWDLLHGTPLSRCFFFGLCVVPSLCVILLQNMILFGENTGNGFALAPFAEMQIHSAHPFIAAALSALFPGMMVLYYLVEKGFAKAWKRKADDTLFPSLVIWGMGFVGFMEYALFSETGGRAGDGNFLWGYSFALFMLFFWALILYKGQFARLGDQKQFKHVNYKKFALHRKLCKVYLVLAGIVLATHLYGGIYFYFNLLQGVSYWMWD